MDFGDDFGNSRDFGDENDWRGGHGYREPSRDELLERDRNRAALWAAIARGHVRRRHWFARLVRWLAGAD